jgi:hypothetical protein
LAAPHEYIGYSGTGTFSQTGGTNATDALTIKSNSSASGVYDLGGGALNATTVNNHDRFNYTDGALNGDVTNNAGATFTLSGAGTRTVNGDVTNHGTLKVAGTTDGTTAVFTGPVFNYATLNSDPATLEFLGDLVVGPDGSIPASAGDQYLLHEAFLIDPLNDLSGWTTSEADLTFTGPIEHLLSFGTSDLTWYELSLEDGAILDFDAEGAFYASVLTGLTINPDRTVANISGTDGFILYYDPTLSPTLSGIYPLTEGGSLRPFGGRQVIPAGTRDNGGDRRR